MKFIKKLFKKRDVSNESRDEIMDMAIDEVLKIDFSNYKTFEKVANKTNVLCGIAFPPLETLSFKAVKIEIPDKLNNEDLEGLFILMGKEVGKDITMRQINRENPNKVMCFLLWIIDEWKKINEREQVMLSSSPDIDMINAGINEFDKFKEMNVVDSIAGGDMLKWGEVLASPYIDVFTKQLMMKTGNDFNKKLHDTQMSKRK